MIRTFTFSQPGGHPINEDAFTLCRLCHDPDGWVACLADGQGGRAGGGQAAQLACRKIEEMAALATPKSLCKSSFWTDALARADRAIVDSQSAGFTTLIGLVVANDRATGASCGDSSVIAVQGSGSVTELTARQFKNPPVGSGEACFVPFEIKLTKPWRLLAMSDGVWKYAGWPRVWELAVQLSGERLLVELQNSARLRGTGQFHDDFTVVLIEASD